MKLYCCQTDITWENKAANYARAHKLLVAAKPERDSLVLLPEMFATGFSMNVPAIQEGAKADTEKFLAQLAQEFGVFMIGGIVASAPDSRGYNQALVIGPDGAPLARYSKMQPFSLGGEAKNYMAGVQPVFFPWQDLKVSPFICYDLRFPEVFRSAVRGGAQMFTVIANWPHMRIHHWVTLLQARAIENQAYVAGVNRCGTDPKFTYNGRSIIVDPHGAILADAGDGERIISAEISPEVVNKWRSEFPALQDMRPVK
jgi:omega-amidase